MCSREQDFLNKIDVKSESLYISESILSGDCAEMSYYSLGKSIKSNLSLKILNCVHTIINLRRYPDV